MVHVTVSNTNEERHRVVFNVFLDLRAFEISHSNRNNRIGSAMQPILLFWNICTVHNNLYLENQIMSCFSAVRGKTMDFF